MEKRLDQKKDNKEEVRAIRNNKSDKNGQMTGNKTADPGIRLQKFLAERGIASRRAAEEMILSGRVSVNGRPVDVLGVKIDPGRDKVSVDGLAVSCRPEEKRYILLYKPAGYICSVHDEKGRRTVLDLLPEVQSRIYPVGRLDYDTSGLLLLTNDGDLTNKLLHPSAQVVKTYLAEVRGVPDPRALDKLRRGVKLADGLTAPASARIIKRRDNGALVELRIHEGRNRQVRRMLEAVGYPVLHLRRSALAFLDLQGLKPGQWRELSGSEVARLKQL